MQICLSIGLRQTFFLAHDFSWLTFLGSSLRVFRAGKARLADSHAVPARAGAESGGRNTRLSVGLSVARRKHIPRANGFFYSGSHVPVA